MAKQAINHATGTAVFSELLTLEPKPKVDVSRRQLVRENRRYISRALKSNYSFAEIAELLRLRGVDISPSTLKHYYYESKTKSKTKKSIKNRQAKDRTQIQEDVPSAPPKKEDERVKLLSMKTGPRIVVGEFVDSA